MSTENITYQITEIRDVEHVVGNVDPVQYKNVYFVGNTAGLIDSFMGFGSLRAIASGVLAARSMIYHQDYGKLIKWIIKDNWRKYKFRKAVNFFSNRSFDRLLAVLNFPLAKLLTFHNPLYKAVFLTPLVRLYNKFKLR